jgi:hypothetical protein
MTLSKFEEAKIKLRQKMDAELKKLDEEEKKEKEKRISPLSSKYTNLMEEVCLKILGERVEEIENVKFKKTEVKKRLLDIMESEIDLMIKESNEDENKIQGVKVVDTPSSATPAPEQNATE